MKESDHYPEAKSAKLKQDLQRLFSPEISDVYEDSERTILLGARTIRRHFYFNMPEEAIVAACEGFTRKRGYLVVAFARYQDAISLFGVEKITSDRISISVVDYDYSGGNGQDWLYIRNVDMRQPVLDYDERLANVVNGCLEFLKTE